MNIQLISDLHLDSTPFTQKINKTADVIVIAGDLAPLAYYRRIDSYFKSLPKSITKIYVSGNHDSYSCFASGMIQDYDEGLTLWAKICSDAGVHYLHEGSTVMVNDVQFIGGTLWSDFKLYEPKLSQQKAMDIARVGINDFNLIFKGGARLTPEQVVQLHTNTVGNIVKALAEHDKNVVITHFLPSEMSVNQQYAGSTLNPYFASDCSWLFGPKVGLWLHGHTHSSCDYVQKGTRVVCNPRGYNGVENPQFNSTKVINHGFEKQDSGSAR